MKMHIITKAKHYHPLAGSGKNVIIRREGMLQTLEVGEQVVMSHSASPDTTDENLATEWLQVSSYAVASLRAIVVGHGKKNHMGLSQIKLAQHLKAENPVPEGKARDENELYVVIYF